MPVSGKNGTVTIDSALAEARTWDFSDLSEGQAYASSDTGGNRARVAGHGDWSGTVTAFPVGGAKLSVVKGTFVSMTLVSDTGETIVDPATDGQAFIDSVDYAVDIEGGTLVGATINFSRGRDNP